MYRLLLRVSPVAVLESVFLCCQFLVAAAELDFADVEVDRAGMKMEVD